MNYPVALVKVDDVYGSLSKAAKQSIGALPGLGRSSGQ